MLPLWLSKIITAIILFVLNVTACFVPFVLVEKCSGQHSRTNVWQTFSSFTNCFSIGLFLSICFLGLYHSSAKKFLILEKTLAPNNPFHNYPIAEAILCAGLFIVWLFEWIIFSFAKHTDTSRSKRLKHIRRSLSNTAEIMTSGVLPCEDFTEDNLNEADDKTELLAGVGLPMARWSDKRTALTCESSLTSSEFPGGCAHNSSVPFNASSSFLKSVMLTFALGIHSVMEGIGFGLLDSVDQVVGMAVAMALHQVLCSATLSIRLANEKRTRLERCLAILLLLGYLVLVPFGTAIGSGIHYYSETNLFVALTDCHNTTNVCTASTNEMGLANKSFNGLFVVALLQNFAASTFLYVIFVDMLPMEAGNVMGHSSVPHTQPSSNSNLIGFIRCLMSLFGFSLIAGLRLLHNSHAPSLSQPLTTVGQSPTVEGH